MSDNTWMTIWTIVLFGVLLSYLGVALWVAIGGMPEIIRLLKSVMGKGGGGQA